MVAGCVAQAEGEVFRRAPFTDFPQAAKFDKLPDECYGNSQGSSAFLAILLKVVINFVRFVKYHILVELSIHGQ